MTGAARKTVILREFQRPKDLAGKPRSSAFMARSFAALRMTIPAEQDVR